MSGPYYINDSMRIWGVFDVDEVLTDPTTITLKIEDPSGNEATYTYAGASVSKHSTGLYYKDFVPDEAGAWKYRWESTGTPQTAIELTFTVQTSVF